MSQLPCTQQAQLHIGGNGDELIVVTVPKRGEPVTWVIRVTGEAEAGQVETPEVHEFPFSRQQVIGVTVNGSILSRDSSGHQIQVMTRTSGQWATSSLILENDSHLSMSRRAPSADIGLTLPSEQYRTGQDLLILRDGRIVTTAIDRNEPNGQCLLLWSRHSDSDATWTYRILETIKETTCYLAEVFPGRLTVCDDSGGIREVSLGE